ncbi:MAG: glycosyltransferase family 9 protein [Alphaproteobacteria bacterium]|nr:glycosyltransferase family 9 protein [Alphaproteobacteria bacterium]
MHKYLRKILLVPTLIIGTILRAVFVRSKTIPIENSKIKNILIVRLDEIGDVVLTSPLLRELRRAYPNSNITLIVKKQIAEFAQNCPHINNVIAFKGYNGLAKSLILPIQSLLFSLQYFNNTKFDLAISPRWDTDNYGNSFICYLSKATWRLGFSEKVNKIKSIKNKYYNRFFTHTLETHADCHEVEKMLKIIEFLGHSVVEKHLKNWTNEDNYDYKESILHNVDINTPIIAIAPTAGHKKREWPLQKFKQVCNKLKSEITPTFIIIGGNDSIEHGITLKDSIGTSCVDITGKATLSQTLTILEACSLYIGNDTGPLHMAASVQTPIVGLFCHPIEGDKSHHNSPTRFGPWMVKNKTIQPLKPAEGCNKFCKSDEPHCICNITPDVVYDAAMEILTSNKFLK